MERYVSDPPLPLAPAVVSGDFEAAQLIFYEVDHSGPSFEALVFLNAPEAGVDTPLEREAGFAGSFVIFGHGGCVGGEGHCDSSVRPADAFDNRPLHPLTRQTKLVDISATLKRVHADGDQLTVTVLPVMPGDESPRLADVLTFSAMRLVAFG
jgi:hypothetical protein